MISPVEDNAEASDNAQEPKRYIQFTTAPDGEDPPTNTTEVSKTVEIDPGGDVNLLCEDLVLRVSSRVLSLASKVFNAMFQTHYQE